MILDKDHRERTGLRPSPSSRCFRGSQPPSASPPASRRLAQTAAPVRHWLASPAALSLLFFYLYLSFVYPVQDSI